MQYLALAALAVGMLCSCSFGKELEATSIEVQPAAVNPNLVKNGGFESLDDRGLPEGWTWDKRNTDAACVVDNRAACEGLRSLRISNGTPLESPYTGQLWTSGSIPVEPGKPYTLSAWTKSEDPGLASFCAGHGWPYRIMLPPTGGKWRLVTTTFVPTQADRNFTIHVQTESPTRGFWLDNVKLEEGTWATFTELPRGTAGIAQVWAQSQELEVFSEGEFSSPFLVSVPKAFSGTLEATISGVKGKISRKVDLAPGVVQVMVRGTSDAAGSAPRTLTFRLMEAGKELASARTSLRFYSTKHTQMRLDQMEQRLPTIKAKLDKLKASGQDISYPLVSYTVLENFIGYAREDASKDEIKRAVQQLSDLESMEKNLSREIADAASGKAKLPAAPRWTGDARPVVKSSSFISTTTTPGKPGVETRPVFFTGYGHFAQVTKDLEKFPGYGVNIIQIEIGPWAILPKEGVIEEKPVESLLGVLDRAKAAGVAVNLLLSPHYVPQWVKDKIKASLGTDHYCPRAPESQEMLKRHISVVIPPIKDHPALHSICLTNEPQHRNDSCELAIADWHAWLAQKHGDIDVLNVRWGTSYASFADVRLPYEKGQTLREPIGRWVDCVRWNQEFFAGWHQMLADAVHSAAPGLPVHAKVQTPTLLNYDDLGAGNDAYLYGRFSDISGNDSVNWPSFGHGEFAQSWMTNARGEDLQRSVKDAPVFDSENHIIGDRDTRYIAPEIVRTALWQQAIHGQSATTIWVWERTFDRTHDFGGSIMHRPGCAQAVGIVNHDLNRAAKEVTALQQAPPQALILHSTSAMIHDGEPYDNCMKKLYMALGFAGVRIGFITERQLEAGIVPAAPVVFIPQADHLSDAAFGTLRKCKGRLVIVGDGGLTRNEYGAQRPDRLAGEMMRYVPSKTSEKDMWSALLPVLRSWGASPRVQVVDGKGGPVWGVEWREADAGDGTVVNLCNYLNVPVRVKLSSDGADVAATDVLTGRRVAGSMELQPLETRLLSVDR